MTSNYVRKESRSLRCDLTMIERQEKAQSVARAVADLEQLEGEKSRCAQQYSNRIKTLTAELRGDAMTLRQGYEFRAVECRVEHVFVESRVLVVREDTGEVVEQREMNREEKAEAARRAQGNLFEEPKPTAAPETTPASAEPEKPRRRRKPNITLAEDEDAQGAETGSDATEEPPLAPVGTSEDPAPAVEGAGEDEDVACLTCEHYESLHDLGPEGHCGVSACRCERFVHPDPLGIAEAGGEAADATP